jgi:hypothetical protein
MAAQEQIQFWKGIWQQGISYKHIQGFVLKNNLFVPLQTLEHPEVQNKMCSWLFMSVTVEL